MKSKTVDGRWMAIWTLHMGFLLSLALVPVPHPSAAWAFPPPSTESEGDAPQSATTPPEPDATPAERRASAAAEQPPSGVDRPAPEPAVIQQWARELSARQFLTREKATQGLIAAGVAAIGPVRQQLNESPEASFRGIHVLQQLALSGDIDTEEQAREALVQIAERGDSRATRLAAASLDDLDQLRQMRTLQYLVGLGAQPTRAYRVRGNTTESYVRDLEIGTEWKGTDDDLKRLRWLTDLESITLEGKQVKNKWLEPLAEMNSLTTLIVKRADITDDALAILPKIQRLTILELKYVPVGDASLPHLASLQNTASMKLYGTQLTMDAADQLKMRLAGTEVDVRRGAFLGVGCRTHALGCQISLIQPGSAADRAGLNSGDIIIEYNGELVEDFEALTRLISLNAVGDEVPLVAVRQAQMIPFRLHVAKQNDSDDQAADEVAPGTPAPVRPAPEPAPAEPEQAEPEEPQPDAPQPQDKPQDKQDNEQLKPTSLDALGLKVEAHPLGCRVTSVEKDKIAYRVGIRKDDVIFLCNNQRISDPASLTAALQMGTDGFHSVEVARSFSILKKSVKLGEWE